MKRLLKWMDQTIDVFMILLLVGIVVVVTLKVLFRYVFHISAPWTEETSRFLFIYLTYIGAALAIKEKSHITIDVLVERLPPLLKLVTIVFVQMAIIFFLLILLKGSWIMVESSQEVSSATMKWLKMSNIYFALFAGSILMIFYSVLRMVETIQGYFSRSKDITNHH